MLKFFSLVSAAILIFLWVNQTPSINYYVEGVPSSIVEHSLLKWKIRPVKTDNQFTADLVVKQTRLHGLWGTQKGRTIYIDKSTKFTNEQISNLITHEIGHYLFLSHDQAQYSIMNDQTSLSKRQVTEKNLASLSYLKLRIAWCKIASKIDLISQIVDFN